MRDNNFKSEAKKRWNQLQGEQATCSAVSSLQVRPPQKQYYVQFPAIGNATYRNAARRNATLCTTEKFRNATQVPLRRSASVRKQIETISIFSVRCKDDSQSEEPTAMT